MVAVASLPYRHPVYYQYGSGIQDLRAFRGPVMQSGYGIGKLFSGLARSFTPVLKRGLVRVGKKALKAGVGVLHDVSQGKNFKQAVRDRAKEGASEAVSSITNQIKQKTASRKRTSTAKGRNRKKKQKKNSDIFE